MAPYEAAENILDKLPELRNLEDEGMHGAKVETQSKFSYPSPEQRVPVDHPLRAIRVIVDQSLAELDAHFSLIYADLGRPSIPPERALLLQVFYGIRPERQLIEQMDYNLLFLWFVGLGVDAPIWVPTVFTKNRDWLLDNGTVQQFFRSVLDQAQGQDLLSEDHFSVDGTLLEAWASQKSFQPKDREGDGSNFLMDNRHGPIAGEEVTTADGTAEVDATVQVVDDLGGSLRISLEADQGYDRHVFVHDFWDRNVTPRVARKQTGNNPKFLQIFPQPPCSIKQGVNL